MKFMYGCCVGSWDKFRAYVSPCTGDRPVVALSGRDAIVPAYNHILDIALIDRVDALVLMHDDLEITDPNFEEKVRVILNVTPDVALIGVAGGGGKSLYWWEHQPVGHQRTDVTDIDFGQRTGDVTLIEGSLMVLSRWAIKNLWFDPRFIDFHGYDEIGAQARDAGKRVVVADIDTHHHNPMGYRSLESAAICRRANEMYIEKWGQRWATS